MIYLCCNINDLEFFIKSLLGLLFDCDSNGLPWPFIFLMNFISFTSPTQNTYRSLDGLGVSPLVIFLTVL